MFLEAWQWITQMGNSKIVALVIFFTTFVGIILYAYASPSRSKRLESYKYIPLQDDDTLGAPKKEDESK